MPTKIKDYSTDIEYIKEGIRENRDAIKRMSDKLDNKYVRKEDIKFVWYLIYGLAGAVISSAIPNILSFVGR